LHQAENVSLGVLAISQPANSGNGHLGKCDHAATGLRPLEILINRRDIHGANVGNDRLAIDGTPALDQTSVDAGLTIRTDLDKPVGLRAIPLCELPLKNVPIESDGAVWIVRMNLEMNYSWHGIFSFLVDTVAG
jgi:hypothetical protein